MKLSIITINFNNKDGLKRTIDSVVAQTHKGFEYIVIDGGSTDGSKDIIEKNAANLTHWVSEKDTGIYNAMNKGVKFSTGDFCLFLNSGDWLYSNTVIDNVMEFLTDNVDLVNGNQWLVDDSGKVSKNKVGCPDQLYLYHLVSKWLSHGSTFIRRDLLLKRPYEEEYRIVSDWIFFVNTFVNEDIRYKHIDVNISYFLMSGISSTQSNLLMQEGQKTRDSIISQKLYEEIKNVPIEITKLFIETKNVTVRHLIVLTAKIIVKTYAIIYQILIKMRFKN